MAPFSVWYLRLKRMGLRERGRIRATLRLSRISFLNPQALNPKTLNCVKGDCDGFRVQAGVSSWERERQREREREREREGVGSTDQM